ncbi:DUF2795 domain-containing protein [Nonomuraea sp. PA05]|uniref:DUF2795 domain-containing protein n=1 Tax=Nonomuraea sp. PA05 TaxID=2604466 RepID=UPI0011D9DC31|nr:DUF2795 domain-containing protein [Nonomuraea sp. PA05]TYB56429.1 DUF2795 domain-containing protein [Nonomuraea sp. PA05]
MKLHDTRPVREALNSLDFPADKESIVAHARTHGAGEDAERALRSLPLGEYASMAEVLRSVPVDPAPGRTEDERMQQHRRQGRKAGLAESMRPSRPKPIDEE